MLLIRDFIISHFSQSQRSKGKSEKKKLPPLENLSRYTELLHDLPSKISSAYPGFRMRLYHNVTMDAASDSFQILCDLFCKYPHVDLCDVREISELRRGSEGELFIKVICTASLASFQFISLLF